MQISCSGPKCGTDGLFQAQWLKSKSVLRAFISSSSPDVFHTHTNSRTVGPPQITNPTPGRLSVGGCSSAGLHKRWRGKRSVFDTASCCSGFDSSTAIKPCGGIAAALCLHSAFRHYMMRHYHHSLIWNSKYHVYTNLKFKVSVVCSVWNFLNVDKQRTLSVFIQHLPCGCFIGDLSLSLSVCLSVSLSLCFSCWGGMRLLGDLELFLEQWGRCKLGARLRETLWSLQRTTVHLWVLAQTTVGGRLIRGGVVIRTLTCKPAVDVNTRGAATLPQCRGSAAALKE